MLPKSAFAASFKKWGRAAITLSLLSNICALARNQKPDTRTASGGAVSRGKYIVESVAMCGQCHTPHDDGGNPDRGHWLQGTPVPWAPAKPDPNWTEQRAADRRHSVARQQRRDGQTADDGNVDDRNSSSASNAPVPHGSGRC
jgi:hypothetical protein